MVGFVVMWFKVMKFGFMRLRVYSICGLKLLKFGSYVWGYGGKFITFRVKEYGLLEVGVTRV